MTLIEQENIVWYAVHTWFALLQFSALVALAWGRKGINLESYH